MKKIRIAIMAALLTTAFVFTGIPAFAYGSAELNHESGGTKTMMEGKVENAYQYGSLMTADEADAVLAAMNDDKKKEIIETIHTGVLNMDDEISLEDYEIKSDDLQICYQALMNNYPDVYFISNSYQYMQFEDEIIDTLNPIYIMEADEVAEVQKQIDDEVDKICENITDGMTRLDKITVVNNYIASHYVYDHVHVGDNTYVRQFTMPALFIDKTAVCQGYGLGFQYIMQKLGIPCMTVQSNAMGHLWNLVQAREDSENWYHIDTTWNSDYYDGGANPDTFFLLSDTKIQSEKWISYNADGTMIDSRHYSYTPEGKATDDIYADLPLTDASGGIEYCDGYWYYTKGDLSGNVFRYSYLTNSEEIIVNVTPDWELSDGRVYTNSFVEDALYDGKIYYNTSLNIMVYDPSTGESKIYAAKPSGVVEKKSCIYKLRIEGDTLIYTTGDAYETNYVEHKLSLISSSIKLMENGSGEIFLSGISGATKIFVACYDAEGRLLEVRSRNHNGDSSAEFTESDLPSNTAEIRSFAWDYTNSKKPVPVGSMAVGQ